jgi:uncharacterized protein YciI
MYFVILAADRPGLLEQRLAHRQEHLDYWNALPGVVKIAGAMLTNDGPDGAPKGSAFIIEAESLAAARALVAGDPFAVRGIFGDEIRVEVLRPGLGEWKPA